MPDGTTKTAEQSRYPVSNYEHEAYQNELKRQILLPTNSLVDLMIDEFEDQIAYEPHPELDDVNNKKTPLSIAARFVDVAGFVSASVSRQSAATSTTTFDYGPTGSAVTSGSVGVATSTDTAAATTTTTSTTTSTTSSTTSTSVSYTHLTLPTISSV